MSGVALFNGKLLKDNANHEIKTKPSQANNHEWCGNTISHMFITPGSCWTRKHCECSFLWAAMLTDCVLHMHPTLALQRSFPCLVYFVHEPPLSRQEVKWEKTGIRAIFRIKDFQNKTPQSIKAKSFLCVFLHI